MSSPKTAQINLRVNEVVVSDLDTLAEHEHVSRVDVARQILLDGIAARKLSLALQLYGDGEVSMSRAAEIAGITMWELYDMRQNLDGPKLYGVQDAVEDVRRLVAEAGQIYKIESS